MPSYPYTSRLREELAAKQAGAEYDVWQNENMQELAAGIHKPVIEIGGPTEGGFYFLDGIQLGTSPVITNISANPLPLHPEADKLAEAVSAQVDGTNLPYEDNSVGIFLMAAMSVSSDWWIALPEEEQDKARPVFDKEFAAATLEMGQVAAGHLQPSDVQHAQRVKIFREVHRCLQENGLFFTDGGIEEIVILQKMGFEIIACLQVLEEFGMARYEFVAAKRK